MEEGTEGKEGTEGNEGKEGKDPYPFVYFLCNDLWRRKLLYLRGGLLIKGVKCNSLSVFTLSK
jgi:hypothetical protein